MNDFCDYLWHLKKFLQDELYFLCLQDLVFTCKNVRGNVFLYPFALLTLFTFWMEGTHSIMGLVSINSQGSETLHWSSDQKMGQQALPQNSSGFFIYLYIHHYWFFFFGQSPELHRDSPQTDQICQINFHWKSFPWLWLLCTKLVHLHGEQLQC